MDIDPSRFAGKVPALPTTARLFHVEIRSFTSPPYDGYGLYIGVKMLFVIIFEYMNYDIFFFLFGEK
jgi:hypothetical protein